jgi:hypothetical protein
MFKVDVIHPEAFFRILRIKRVSQTQICDICNNIILHFKGYMFRLWVIFRPSRVRSIVWVNNALWDPQHLKYPDCTIMKNVSDSSVTRMHTDYLHRHIPKVNHPGLGTTPVFTRRATGCRFLPEHRTASHSEEINTIIPYWHRTEQATSTHDIPRSSYTTRDTRIHFNTPPPAASRPTHISNSGSWTNLTPPPRFPRSAWCTHFAPSCWSIPNQVLPNPRSNTTTNPPTPWTLSTFPHSRLPCQPPRCVHSDYKF